MGWLTAYAIAMAHVEAALVIHLRRLHYPSDPLDVFPLTMLPYPDLAIELVRELATLVMILSVAFLYAKWGVRVFAAFAYTFGIWDIAYYGWLKVMLGWPTSKLEWDVLFLISWPWLGPWIAPVLVAVVFVVRSGRTLSSAVAPPLMRGAAAAVAAGAAIIVSTFLIAGFYFVAGAVPDEGYRPGEFHWGVFALGCAIMTAGLFMKTVPQIPLGL